MKNRIERERYTVEVMIRLYCVMEHDSVGICRDCDYLIGYAGKKLARCPFGNDKPACNLCTVHCYLSDERERIREIMRYSGPKMLFRHPYLSIMHILDKRRKPITGLSPLSEQKSK